MNFANQKKLTADEVQRLLLYIKNTGTALQTAALLGVRPETLSKTINRRTAPSPDLRKKLAAVGVVKA